MRVGRRSSSPSVHPSSGISSSSIQPVQEHSTRQRVAVGVEARGRQAQDRIAGTDRLAEDQRVRRDRAHTCADQVESAFVTGHFSIRADDLRELRDLASGDRDSGFLRSRAEPLEDLIDAAVVESVNADVVDQREGPGSDADHVVDVHRDAVEPDRVVAIELRRHDRLGADPIRADRDAELVAKRDHARGSDRSP